MSFPFRALGAMLKPKPFLIFNFCFLFSFLSVSAQTDVTSSIVNPEFDGLGFGGWKNNGFWTQTNNEFSGKSNYAYAERWVPSPLLPEFPLPRCLPLSPSRLLSLPPSSAHMPTTLQDGVPYPMNLICYSLCSNQQTA